MNAPATLQLACAQPTHVVIWTEANPPNSSSNPLLSVLLNRLNDLENRFNAITATLIAQTQPAPAPAPAEPGLYFPRSLSPHLTGLNVQPIPSSPSSPQPQNDDLPEEAEAEGEEIDGEGEEEAEAEAEEEDLAQTLEEFEWKGVSYWKDSDNQVYEKDEDGDLNDSPIGVWNEAKQKLQRYAKAV